MIPKVRGDGSRNTTVVGFQVFVTVTGVACGARFVDVVDVVVATTASTAAAAAGGGAAVKNRFSVPNNEAAEADTDDAEKQNDGEADVNHGDGERGTCGSK